MKKLLVLFAVAMLVGLSIFFSPLAYSQNPEWKVFFNTIGLCALAEEGDFMWVGTSGGLYKIEKNSGAVAAYYDSTNSGLPSCTVLTIAIDKKGNKWIGNTNIRLGGDGCGLIKFNGSSWTVYDHSNSGLPQNRIWELVIDTNDDVWIGMDYLTIFPQPQSRNTLARFDGTNWILYNENFGLPFKTVRSIAIDESGTKWLAMGVFMKYDDKNWTKYDMFSGLPSDHACDVAIDRNGNKWIGINAGVRQGGLVKYDGTTWTIYNPTNSGLPDTYVFTVAVDSSNAIWAGTSKGLCKFDGTSWTTYNTSNSGLPSDMIHIILIDSVGNKWIGTGSGLAVFNETGIITAVESTPSPLTLHQNYPNPFNPTTLIPYSIPEPGTVSLTIHNSLGQRVRTLVNTFVPAGEHTAIWDGLDYAGNPAANGVYFYRLQAGDAVQANKMLLMK